MEDTPATPTREPRRESRGGTPRGAATLSSPRDSPATKAAGGATPRSPRPRTATLADPPSWVECTERKGSHASHSSALKSAAFGRATTRHPGHLGRKGLRPQASAVGLLCAYQRCASPATQAPAAAYGAAVKPACASVGHSAPLSTQALRPGCTEE